MNVVRIVDYGIGNLHSVQRAFSTWCDDVAIVQNGADLAHASHVVLPGVGAFGAAMSEVRRRGLKPHLSEFVASGRPVIGLCVGMQILADTGLEDGTHSGLGLVPGTVRSLRESHPDATVPNIGWREVSGEPDGSILFPTSGPTDLFYFAHSYEFVPDDSSHVTATTEFCGRQVVAAVRRENVWGVQFHPEKSAAAGLALLRRFVEMT